jgi:menaquinone-dependent protoporphyrinogen IX oxidase
MTAITKCLDNHHCKGISNGLALLWISKSSCMKGIIIYKGKYNSTRQYAEWLATELNMPLALSENTGKEQLRNYDLVVAGSPVYVGKLLIKKWMKQHVAELQGKKIFLFVVCGTPPDKKEKLQRYLQASVPAEIRNRCETYFLPGRMILKDLSGWDRFMMKMGALLEKEPEAKKEMRMEYDGVKKENLNELLKAIKKTVVAKRENVQEVS